MIKDLTPKVEPHLDVVLQDNDATFAFVATSGYVLLVNLKTKQVIPLESNRPEYYGVSWFPGSPNLVLSHSNVNNAEMLDLTAYSQSEVGVLSHGQVVSPPFLSLPHQILCAPDGRVICTNTGRNSVTVIDLAKPNHFQEVRVSPARWDRLSLEVTTGGHCNSVFLRDDRLYVVAHGHAQGSQLITYSYPDLEIVAVESIIARTGLHNIWFTEDGQRIACNSSGGSLVELNSNQTLWNSGCSVYTRGLAASSSFVLVGESQCSERDLRRSSMSGLWLLDRRTWKALDYFCLGPYGVVHEVRLANVKDEAHHGHVFGGLERFLMTNLSTELTAEKMRRTSVAQRSLDMWKGFEVVFGVPTVEERGGRICDADQLCLLTQATSSASEPRRMSFRYSLDMSSGPSHVSVVNYRGKGADTDMHAILLQPVDSKNAHLSLWVHDGKTWSVQSNVSVGGLPLAAEADVRTDKNGTKLFINNKMVVHLNPQDLPLDAGAMGLRWMGASVLPIHNRS